jgi:O-antigen ligase
MTAKATYLGSGAGMAFRANALLGHPNLLAAFLALQLPICVALMFSRLSVLMRALIGGATVLGMAALMMTLSRSGWFSFGIAVALLFVLSFVHPRLQRRYLFARVAAILFIVVVVASFSGAIIKRLTESDPGAVNFRLEWNQVAWEMVQEKPIIGFGLNTFVYHLPGRTHYGGPKGLNESLGSIWPVVHNTYLLTWAEQGTIGFVLFIGLHWAIIAAAVRNIRRYYNDVLFAVNLGCLCGIVALMFDGLASFYLRMPAPSRMFWVVTAIIFAIDRWNTLHAPRVTTSAGAAPRRPAAVRDGSAAGGAVRPA